MRHLSTSQICAKLPIEVWNVILAKTDPYTCLVVGRDDAIANFEGWTRQEERRWLRKAILNGHLGVVQALYQKNNFVNIRDDALDLAAEYGHLHIVEWLPIDQDMCKKRTMNRAAKNGHLEVIRWLHENLRDPLMRGPFQDDGSHDVDSDEQTRLTMSEQSTPHAMSLALATTLIMSSRLGLGGDMSKTTNGRKIGCTTIAMDRAAQNGHLEVVKWLHKNRREGCTKDAMNSAAANGHMHIVKWLHQNRREGCTKDAMDRAAQNAQLEVLKWLHENRREGCTTNAMDWAAANEHFDILKWLHENRREGYTTYAMAQVAGIGRLDILKWLYERKPKKDGCTGNAMVEAAKNGHLEIVRWLYEHDFSEERSFNRAVRIADVNGHLDIVEWLKKQHSFWEELQRPPPRKRAITPGLPLPIREWLSKA